MKAFAIIALLVLAVVGIISAWYKWDSGRNRGSQFGYFGEYNRVSNALASIPGVVITQKWHHLDVSLEEFGFDLTVTGRPVRLYFGETDPIRRMSHSDAIATLKRRISTEISASNTNQ